MKLQIIDYADEKEYVILNENHILIFSGKGFLASIAAELLLQGLAAGDLPNPGAFQDRIDVQKIEELRASLSKQTKEVIESLGKSRYFENPYYNGFISIDEVGISEYHLQSLLTLKEQGLVYFTAENIDCDRVHVTDLGKKYLDII